MKPEIQFAKSSDVHIAYHWYSRMLRQTASPGTEAAFERATTGKKPIKAIHEREEIFKGSFADRAPDIMMVPAEGYSFAHSKSPIEDAD